MTYAPSVEEYDSLVFKSVAAECGGVWRPSVEECCSPERRDSEVWTHSIAAVARIVPFRAALEIGLIS